MTSIKYRSEAPRGLAVDVKFAKPWSDVRQSSTEVRPREAWVVMASSEVPKGDVTEDGCRFRGLDVDTDEEDDKINTDNREEAIKEACTDIKCSDESCVKSVEALKKLIQDQAAQITDLQEKLQAITTRSEETDSVAENTTKKRKREGTIGSLMNVAMIADASDKDIKIVNLTTENERLKQQNLAVVNKPAVEEKSTETTLTRALPLPNTSTLIQQIQRSIDERFTELKDHIGMAIDERIKIVRNSASYASKVRNDIQDLNNQSSSSAPEDVQSFRSIMMNARNEDLAEKRDKKMRSTNIIIHGPKESTKEEDQKFVEDLLTKVDMEPNNVKSVQRIGKPDTNGPIKVELSTEKDKVSLLQNLRKLKDDERYKGIGITEDYTFSERKLIQEYNVRAKERNENDPEKDSYVWRVRGSPKNGLFIKKFRKIQGIQ